MRAIVRATAASQQGSLSWQLRAKALSSWWRSATGSCFCRSFEFAQKRDRPRPERDPAFLFDQRETGLEPEVGPIEAVGRHQAARAVAEGEDLPPPVAAAPGMFEGELEMSEALLDAAPVDKVEAVDCVDTGQAVAVLYQTQSFGEMGGRRRPAARLALDEAEFAERGRGNVGVAALPCDVRRLAQVDRAFIGIAPGKMDERRAEFEE